MAKGDVYNQDITKINDHIYEVESNTTDRTYRVDVSVPHCTCEGFARMFNTSKKNGVNPPVGYCKHLTAVKHYFRVPPVQASPPRLTDKEKMNIRWRREKAQIELERDLADLRGDDA